MTGRWTWIVALTAALAAVPATAAAADLDRYALELRLQADGTAVAVIAITADAGVREWIVPFGETRVRDLAVLSGPQGTLAAVRPAGRQSALVLTLPRDARGQATVTLQCAVGSPEAARSGDRFVVRHALVNSEPGTIRSYRLDLLFPDGTRGHAIREAVPALRKNEIGPRVTLDTVGGRPGAHLQVSDLVQGDTAVAAIELVPQRRSPAWLIAGVVLAALYLRSFRRDVRPDAPADRRLAA